MSLSDKYNKKKADNVDSETMEFSPKLSDDAEQGKEKELLVPLVQWSEQKMNDVTLEIKMEENDDEEQELEDTKKNLADLKKKNEALMKENMVLEETIIQLESELMHYEGRRCFK